METLQNVDPGRRPGSSHGHGAKTILQQLRLGVVAPKRIEQIKLDKTTMISKQHSYNMLWM